MAEAYIFCPDVITDSFDKTNKHHLFSIALISMLNEERFRPSSLISKKYRGFVSDYHKSQMIDIAIKLMNEEEIGEEEIYLLGIILGALEEEGIDFDKYEDEYSPLFDLAEQIEDTYDVYIVCNNGKAHEIQKEKDKQFTVINSEEAFLQVLEKRETSNEDI